MHPKQAPCFKLFQEEAAEHLQQLQRGLLALKHHARDEAVLREVTQSANTLMSSALTVGFEEMSQQARSIRNRLADARDGTSPLDAATLDLLLQRLEALGSAVDTGAAGENGEAVVGVPHMTISAIPSALDQLYHEILRVEQPACEAALVPQAWALAYALQERAETGSMDAIAHVAQRLADIFQAAEQGRLVITAEIRSLLLQGVGFIELLLDAAATGNKDELEVDELCALLDESLSTVVSEEVSMAPAVADAVPLEVGEETPPEMPGTGREGRQGTTIRRHVKVLIASHSTLFSRTLSDVISQAHHEVRLTQNAYDVVSHLKNKDIDLCFIRDALPGSFEICEHFASDPAGSQAIPVILYSPLARVKDCALARGAADFLHVPCQPQEVLALVERWGKRPRQP